MRNKREQHARKPPIPREFGRLVPARQEEHGEVVDICAGGAGADEAADALQCGIGIVAPQNIGGVKSGGAERGKAVLIDEAACGIGRAVASVGAEGKTAASVSPVSPSAAASASSWFRPPRPAPVRCTTVSPPARNASGSDGEACVRATAARKRPASRASQFRQSVSRMQR